MKETLNVELLTDEASTGLNVETQFSGVFWNIGNTEHNVNWGSAVELLNITSE